MISKQKVTAMNDAHKRSFGRLLVTFLFDFQLILSFSGDIALSLTLDVINGFIGTMFKCYIVIIGVIWIITTLPVVL